MKFTNINNNSIPAKVVINLRTLRKSHDAHDKDLHKLAICTNWQFAHAVLIVLALFQFVADYRTLLMRFFTLSRQKNNNNMSRSSF